MIQKLKLEKYGIFLIAALKEMGYTVLPLCVCVSVGD